MGEFATRADPDALLRRVQADEARSGRAKLKIYFGFAPGVGKTFAMLETARSLAAAGADVLVGCVETHGRSETQALLDGLAVLPRRAVEYRGVTLQEFDLEAALERKPAILLLDELAHTNAPGVIHAKRWQDALDLLDAGIEVHTTLNVQHVESLNDVVTRITTVRVRETVPDALLERADQIELIDLPADALLARLREGKVYVPDLAARALESFFREGNLLALREIALRRTADIIDADVRAYREAHAIATPWPTAERIVVGVGPSPSSAGLLRSARRMADGLRGSWTAVWVEGSRPLGDDDRHRLEANLRLAESLGGTVVRLSGTSRADAILRYARRHNATRLIIGRPTRSRLRDLLRGSLLEELVRGSGGIDVHVISGAASEEALPLSETSERPSEWPAYLLAAQLVAVATIVSFVVDAYLAPADTVMTFLVAIIVSALRVGRGPSVFAAALSVAAYDFFFVGPRFTFAVSDTRHVLTFAMMFGVGILLSELTRRLRTQEREARRREAYTAALFALARDLGAAADKPSVAGAIAARASDAFNGTVAVLLAEGEGELREVARSGDAVLDARDRGVARWAHEHGRPAGLGTDTLPGAAAACVPLRTDARGLGVIAFVPRVPGRVLDGEQRHLLEALARQAALAIERVVLAAEAKASELRARTENMRSSLLSAVSHDLRTPLAAITGAATSLRGDEAAVHPEQRRELIETICEESTRLERLVANLLEMTRVEAGAIEVHREWVPAEEIVGAVLTRLEGALAGRPVHTSLDPALPLLPVDPVLVEQVLMNLIDNAIKHTPAGSPIDVFVTGDADRIMIEVADRGPGLAPGSEEQVFQKFHRGAAPGIPGVGLGLAICRGIVEAHGGTIKAASRTGGGANFTVTLPVVGSAP
ncbi:MAG TPA: sensor histidine kinase KdpD [Candidatus Polarisedimenticolaceae bacterium]|nr:sensor histidine kinase KdpD [Candidatus Polarisedimenticolaceae bacterium]